MLGLDECVLCRSEFHRDVRHLRADLFRQLFIQQVPVYKDYRELLTHTISCFNVYPSM